MIQHNQQSYAFESSCFVATNVLKGDRAADSCVTKTGLQTGKWTIENPDGIVYNQAQLETCLVGAYVRANKTT